MQVLTSRGQPSKTLEDAWIVEVPIAKSNEHAKRVVKLVNIALAKLDGDTRGLIVTEDDIASITAEWTAIKSDTSSKRQWHMRHAKRR